jgi:serine/threonine protein kinase
MISAMISILLGDFGATTNEERLDGQTGIYSPYYADIDARLSKFSPKSDIYALGLCIYYIMHGKHLYSKETKQKWLDNGLRDTEGLEYMLLRPVINECLTDETNNRPNFKLLSNEIIMARFQEYA